MDVVVHRGRTRGRQELYSHNVVVLEFEHFGTDPRILGVALGEHDDRRLSMFEHGDRYRADRHHLGDDVHVRIPPLINSVIRWNHERNLKKKKLKIFISTHLFLLSI